MARQTDKGWLASTPKKLRDGSRRSGESFVSPDDQVKRIKAACRRDGLRLVDVVREMDVSGGTPPFTLFSPSSPDARYYKAQPRQLSRLPRPQVEAYFAGLFSDRFQVSGFRFQI